MEQHMGLLRFGVLSGYAGGFGQTFGSARLRRQDCLELYTCLGAACLLLSGFSCTCAGSLGTARSEGQQARRGNGICQDG